MTQRLLLVEDDPPTRLYLGQILADMGFSVREHGTLADARAAIASQRFDLWLCDANLPDGSAVALLADQRQAASRAPAIAMSADHEPDHVAELTAAGFLLVLQKPLAADALREAVALCLPESQPLWNDAHALAAAGVESTKAALRKLFLDELPRIEAEVVQACVTGNGGHLRALLHRLRGSSALVGAHRLHACAANLARAPQRPGALEAFQRACRQTLAGSERDALS